MLRACVIALYLVVVGGCSKKDDAAKAPVVTTAPDGTRKIAIEANENGYVPAEITGKPGEKLVLVFTRTVDGDDCLGKVKFPDGKSFDLPKNKPTEVPVTVPQSGKLEFVCAMDMFKGTVAPKS